MCLNGFGIPLVEGRIPKFRNDFRGPFKKGLLCSVMYITDSVKYCDKRWFVFSDSRNIMQTLFGEAWATKHQDEKIILDFIISVLKTVEVYNMESYLINIDELRKRLGLKSNRHKNNIISDEEQKFIEDDYKKTLQRIRDFRYNEYSGWDDLINHMKDTQELCKAAKPYSDLCKEIISDRLDFVFKGQKKVSKKQPIIKLIADKKTQDVVNYVKVFNPCRAAGCKVPFRVGSVPQTDEERNRIKISLREWKNSQKGVNALQSRLPLIESWYYEVLDL
jgi:RNase P protein component